MTTLSVMGINYVPSQQPRNFLSSVFSVCCRLSFLPSPLSVVLALSSRLVSVLVLSDFWNPLYSIVWQEFLSASLVGVDIKDSAMSVPPEDAGGFRISGSEVRDQSLGAWIQVQAQDSGKEVRDQSQGSSWGQTVRLRLGVRGFGLTSGLHLGLS